MGGQRAGAVVVGLLVVVGVVEATPLFLTASRWTPHFGYTEGWRNSATPRMVGDVDGDGKADVVGCSMWGVDVLLSSGSGFHHPIRRWRSGFGYGKGWDVADHPRMLADVSGDGKADMVGFWTTETHVSFSTGESFAAPWEMAGGFGTASGWREYHKRLLADVNGDGKLDIVGFGEAGVWVVPWYPNDEGPIEERSGKVPELWLANFGWGQGWTDIYPKFVEDVNGDGKADVVVFGLDGVHVALSSGSSFGAQSVWVYQFGNGQLSGSWDPLKHPRMVADVNGDGKADAVGFGHSGVYVSLSTGSGFGQPQMWLSGMGYAAYWRVDRHPRMLVDVNGDGKADVVGFGDNGVIVALSTGTSFTDGRQWVAGFGYNDGWRMDRHPRMLADMNGDGWLDVVGFGHHGVYVSLAACSATGYPVPGGCQCYDHWMGQYCETPLPCPTTKVRKSWYSLSTLERAMFQEGIRALQDAGTLAEFNKVLKGNKGYATGPGHLPWNRQYLKVLEDKLHNLGGKFRCMALPYWPFERDGDLEDRKDAEIWQPTPVGWGSALSGCAQDHDPYYAGWGRCVTRSFDGSDTPPSANEVADGISSAKYYARDKYRSVGRGFGQVSSTWTTRTRKFVGGDMQPMPVTDLDPLAFLMRCNFDRLWALWQDCRNYETSGSVGYGQYEHQFYPYGDHRDTYIPGGEDPMVTTVMPFQGSNVFSGVQATPKDVMWIDSENLAYRYDLNIPELIGQSCGGFSWF